MCIHSSVYNDYEMHLGQSLFQVFLNSNKCRFFWKRVSLFSSSSSTNYCFLISFSCVLDLVGFWLFSPFTCSLQDVLTERFWPLSLRTVVCTLGFWLPAGYIIDNVCPISFFIQRPRLRVLLLQCVLLFFFFPSNFQVYISFILWWNELALESSVN